MNGENRLRERIQQILNSSISHAEKVEQISAQMSSQMSKYLRNNRANFYDYDTLLHMLNQCLEDRIRAKRARYQKLISIYSRIIGRLNQEHPYEAEFVTSRLIYRSLRYTWFLSLRSFDLVKILKFSILMATIPWIWILITLIVWLTFGILFYYTGSVPNFFDSLYSSVMTFTSLGIYSPCFTKVGKILVTLEVTFGYFMLGTLISIITRKILKW